MQRTITIHRHEDFGEATANDSVNVNHVVGYLSMWAIHNERYLSYSLLTVLFLLPNS